MNSEPRTVFPCGCMAECQVIDGENIFVFVPCSLDCQYYIYVQQEAARQAKELRIIDSR